MNEIIQIGRWDSAFFGEYVKLHVTLAENLAELFDKPADKIKCSEMRVEKLKELEKFIDTRVKTGTEPPQNLNVAKAVRIDAEIDLLKLKETLKVGNADSSDPDALMKQMIAAVHTLASAIDKKESADKIKDLAQKLKATGDKIDALNLSADDKKKLEEKYKKEMTDALGKLFAAALSNPEGAKALEGFGKPPGK